MTIYDWKSVLFKAGDLFLPTGLRKFLEYYHVGDNHSVFYISNWTVVHFLSGVFLAKYFVSQKNYTSNLILFYTFVIHTFWELFQIYGKNTPIHTLRGKVDVLVDTVAYMLGVIVYLKYEGYTLFRM